MADTSITTASQKADPKDNAATTTGATTAARSKELQKVVDDASKARQKAEEARAKANDASLSTEERAAAKAEAEADDAAAAAAEAMRGSPDVAPVTTVADAGVIAPVDGSTDLADPRAVKRGNDPANPMPLSGAMAEGRTARMTLISPDTAAPREIYVNPDMVGDYARAGYSLAS